MYYFSRNGGVEAVQLCRIDQPSPVVSLRTADILPAWIARNTVGLLLPIAAAACFSVYAIVSHPIT